MAKLTNYELANLAMWSFDFDQAGSLFNAAIEQSSEKTDLLGTWGAMENSLIMRESKPGNWGDMDQVPNQKEISKPYIRPPVTGLIEERERVRRFESFISAKEKEILRNLQKQKSRFRDKLLSDGYGRTGAEPASGQLLRKLNGPWFLAVQRLVSMCVGRAYRRDGEVPDMPSVQKNLQGTGISIKHSDNRCVVVIANGLSVEVWFDGRICCTAPAERFDDVVAALELMSKVSDSALAI